MTDQERQTLAQIARRLLRDGHISIVEANFVQALISRPPQRPETEYIASAAQQHPPAEHPDVGDHDERIA